MADDVKGIVFVKELNDFGGYTCFLVGHLLLLVGRRAAIPGASKLEIRLVYAKSGPQALAIGKSPPRYVLVARVHNQ